MLPLIIIAWSVLALMAACALGIFCVFSATNDI